MSPCPDCEQLSVIVKGIKDWFNKYLEITGAWWGKGENRFYEEYIHLTKIGFEKMDSLSGSEEIPKEILLELNELLK